MSQLTSDLREWYYASMNAAGGNPKAGPPVQINKCDQRLLAPARTLWPICCAVGLIAFFIWCLPGAGQAAGGGSMSGTIRRADNGEPIVNATVGLTSDRSGGFDTVSSILGEVRSDSSGHYEFTGIRPGSEYHVHASKTGYLAQTYDEGAPAPAQAITVPFDGQVNNIDFRLVRAGVVTGTFLDNNDDPIEGIDVEALRMQFQPGLEPTSHAVKTARTDDTGSYRIAGLQPGSYYVRIAPPKQRNVMQACPLIRLFSTLRPQIRAKRNVSRSVPALKYNS